MRRTRLAVLGVAAAVILGGGGLIAMGVGGQDGGSGLLPSSLTRDDKPSASAPSAAERARAERARRVKQLDAELKKVSATSPEFSVAVLDKKTGQTYAYRGAVKYDTASIVKAQILACMLLRAQDKDRAPSDAEMELAGPMIRLSDNDATTALFQRLGGRSAIGKCNKRLGLSQTVVDSRWGFTRTTAADQVRLLNEFVDAGPLNADSRKIADTLMSTVDESQTWGVPAIAKAGESTTVKNGWDTRSAEGGLWAVNTIGRVTSADGATDVSVAVLSHKSPTMDDGVALVEKVAQLTRQYLKY